MIIARRYRVFVPKMIESLFDQITSLPSDEAEKSDSPPKLESANAVVTALPIVRSIVNRKIRSSWHADASDLMQGITLRLLKWREKYHKKGSEMSPHEWESFAARTTYNEINRYFRSQKTAIFCPAEEAEVIVAQESAEGNTELEFISLANMVWQKICVLSLRQRRALLLNSQEVIIYFLKAGVEDREMIKVLEIESIDWDEVKCSLPLTDVQIAKLVKKAGSKRSIEFLSRSMKKARHEARKKLRRLMET